MDGEQKIIHLGDRQFLIKKMTAKQGSWIAMQLFTKLIPIGIAAFGDMKKANSMIKPEDIKKMNFKMPDLSAIQKIFTEDEFYRLQDTCLSCCYEVLKGGNIPVIGDNGAWGVQGLEHDTIKVMSLTINALTLSVAGFFEGNALKELIQSLSGLSLFGVSR
jgi:hypothetical protein